jgi:O-antigen/teichoic acid export membrane protein
MSGSGLPRAQRLLGGWSANLVQLVLGITQQLVLVPIFLRFESSEVLAAWLAVYAAGNLAQVADVGLQSRAINRFLSFRSSADADGRTARYYAAMQRVYWGLSGLLIVSVVIGAFILRPANVFGFAAVPGFDFSFVIMMVGMLVVLPSNLPIGLYRARGLYARAVWMVCAAMLVSQLGQIVTLATTGGLRTVTTAYVLPLVLVALYIALIDVRRLFPFLHRSPGRERQSWHWIGGQFRRALPFAVAGSTEIALQNLPVLLVSALVVDRNAVVQWGLTRVAAGLVRSLCTQATLPLAAELGHDHAVGAKCELRRLYARGSAFVTLLASLVVAAFLAFWPDFFSLWTHGLVPYDPLLTVTLLVGAAIVAPGMLALGYAYHTDRGDLLARSKGLQLAAFLILAVVLTPRLGSLGAAIAIVATDFVAQFGLLGLTIIWQTLERPLRHLLFLAALSLFVMVAGWGLGQGIRTVLPGSGLTRFIVECALWLAVVALGAVAFLNRRLRSRLSDMIPN